MIETACRAGRRGAQSFKFRGGPRGQTPYSTYVVAESDGNHSCSSPWRFAAPHGSAQGQRSLARLSRPGSARVAVFALPPLGGTTLVPIPRAGARAQGLLQGKGVRETLVRGLGQTS